MSKKTLFMNGSKLTAMSLVVLLAMFCVVGMSFTPGEEGENVGNPNDTTYVSGPRRSHYTTSGCNSTTHSENDWGKVVAITAGNGIVSLTSSGGGVVSSTTPTTGESESSADGKSVTIVWNCGESGKSTGTAANHTRSFTFSANPDDGYNFAGWWTAKTGGEKVSGDLSYTESQELDAWNSDTKYTTEAKAKTRTLYARFEEKKMVTVTLGASENGSYTYSSTAGNGTVSSTTSPSPTITTDSEIGLNATPASGYKFFGWYSMDGEKEKFVSYSSNPSLVFSENVTIYAKFIPSDAALYQVKGVTTNTYYDLTVALTAASSASNKVVFPTINGTLYGTHTIPNGVTLLIPYESTNSVTTTPKDVQTWANLSEYRKLKLAADANLTVANGGAICLAGQQFGTSSSNPGPGSVLGAYSVLDMSEGGHITVANGGKLYAYGFIVGKGNQSTSGTITIQDGGTVYEELAINDLHGGGGTGACVNGSNAKNDYGLFPFSQYYIQNIEPRMTIEYGGLEMAYYDIQSSQGGLQDKVNVIGKNSSYLFELKSGATFTKWYDANRDYQCFEVKGSMSMNALTVDAGVASMASNNFILPVNNNMEITVVGGSSLDIPYSTKFLPGSKLIIEESATVTLKNELYFYDYQDWDYYAMDGYAKTFGTTTAGKKYAWHTLRDVSAPSKLGNAVFVVNGILNLDNNAALYTTSHGGAITSTGSGRIIFNVAGKTGNKNLYECWKTYGKKSNGGALAQGETDAAAGQVQVGKFSFLKTWYIFGTPVATTPAQLKNADGSYTATAGAAANDEFRYVDGEWINAKTITWNLNGGTSETPASILITKGAALNTVMEELPSASRGEDYIFDGWYTAANGGSKVELGTTVSGNVTYYAQWKSTITWNNYDGTLIDETVEKCNTVPSHADATKAPEPTTENIYVFSGWNPAIHAVDGPATYKAVFVPQARPYEITWVSKNGADESKTTVTYDSTPSAPTNIVTTFVGPDTNPELAGNGKKYKYSFTGEWKDAEGNDIAKVTGDRTYFAQYVRKLIIEVGEVSEEAKATEEENLMGQVDAAIDNLDVDESTTVNKTTVGADGTLTVTPKDETPVVLDSKTVTVEIGGTVSIGANTTVQAETTTISGDVEVNGTLQTDNTIVSAGGTLTIAVDAIVENTEEAQDNEEITTITKVKDGGTINIGNGATLTTDVFELTATQTTVVETNAQEQQTIETNNTSGQVVNNGGNVDVKKKAYFKLSHNGGFKARKWYAIAAPWEINVPTDNREQSGFAIYRNGQYEKLLLGRDFELRRYSGWLRALLGNLPQCWTYVEDEEQKVMRPGVFYMVYMLNATDTIRFEKMEEAAFHYAGGVTIEPNDNNGSADPADANWNGIANPNTYHSTVQTSAQVIQTYVVDEDGNGQYAAVSSNEPLTVGTPVFVQTEDQTTMVQPNNAPLRARASMHQQKIEVRIAPVDLHYSDRLFIQTEEGKEDSYTIGADVAKAGVSSRFAQMWVNRYNQKLCFNTISPVRNSAAFPLGISIPKAGEYVISVPELSDGDNVYLTIDGKVVWNLSMAPYSAMFEQGTSTRYGLRLVRSDAPAVTTDIEQLGTDPEMHGVQKVLIDNQVYVLREGEWYNMTGQKAR